MMKTKSNFLLILRLIQKKTNDSCDDKNYKLKVKENRPYFDLNFFLAMPTPMCFLYGLISLMVFIIQL